MGRSLLVQETKVARGEYPDVALAPHEAVESSSRESERCKSSKRLGVGATHGAPVQGHKVAKQVGGVLARANGLKPLAPLGSPVR